MLPNATFWSPNRPSGEEDKPTQRQTDGDLNPGPPLRKTDALPLRYQPNPDFGFHPPVAVGGLFIQRRVEVDESATAVALVLEDLPGGTVSLALPSLARSQAISSTFSPLFSARRKEPRICRESSLKALLNLAQAGISLSKP